MAEDSPRLGEEARPNENQHDNRSGASGQDGSRDRGLIEAVDLVIRSRSAPDLFREIAPRILDLTECDFLKFSQHDPSQNCMVTGWVWMRQETITISDVEKEKRYPTCMQELRKHGVRSYTVLPVSTAKRRFGAIGLGKKVPEILDSGDLEFFHRVAFLVSLALENQQVPPRQ
jgi:formate hydrogenlyase transcriptional activator